MPYNVPDIHAESRIGIKANEVEKTNENMQNMDTCESNK